MKIEPKKKRTLGVEKKATITATGGRDDSSKPIWGWLRRNEVPDSDRDEFDDWDPE